MINAVSGLQEANSLRRFVMAWLEEFSSGPPGKKGYAGSGPCRSFVPGFQPLNSIFPGQL
jgi:hypothetical protein